MQFRRLLTLTSAVLIFTGCDQPSASPTSKPASEAPPQTPAVAQEPWIPAANSPDWEPFNTSDTAPVVIKDHEIHLGAGPGVIGIGYRGKRPIPVVDYELSYEAKKLEGDDFFGAATFPVRSKETCATFINGGWGGLTTGISCIDYLSAVENKSLVNRGYERDQWYKFRIQVTADMIVVYIDDEKTVNCRITDNKINVRLEVEPCQPLGFATWQTKGIVRNISIRNLKPGEVPIDPNAP